MRVEPTYKQFLAYQELGIAESKTEKTSRYVVLGGGAGGGKSWAICEWLLVLAYSKPGMKAFIGREELKRLMGSTYVTWTKVCKHHNISPDDWSLNGQYNYIQFKNGSRIDLLDVKYLPTDPLYERFGSLEYTVGALEEAGEMNFLAFDVLKSRINRHMNKELNVKAKILITCNPKKNWLYQIVYKPWKLNQLPKEYAFIQSLYKDNKYTAESYGENLEQISDKALKQRLMFGNWEYDDDPANLIQYDAITDLFTNTVLQGDKFMTVDVARFGNDKTVISYWDGLQLYKMENYTKQALNITVDKIKEGARNEQVPFSHICIDEDGVGGGVVDNLFGVKGFVANSSATKGNYKTLKSECGYLLAEMINTRQIAVKIADEKIRSMLIEELEQIKGKDIDKEGKLQLIPKDEIKELIGRSPDYSDTMLMRMYFELKINNRASASQFYPTSTIKKVHPFNASQGFRTSTQMEREERPKAKTYYPSLR